MSRSVSPILTLPTDSNISRPCRKISELSYLYALALCDLACPTTACDLQIRISQRHPEEQYEKGLQMGTGHLFKHRQPDRFIRPRVSFARERPWRRSRPATVDLSLADAPFFGSEAADF
jgi:hypothetical protein